MKIIIFQLELDELEELDELDELLLLLDYF
jgi:hypothetical protein